MAAVVLNKYVETALPSVEVVDVTLAADGDTYDSRKFREVQAVNITQLGTIGATDAYSVSSISTNRITFKAVGTTTPRLMVTIFGVH
jgi:hypothetical protein